MNNLFRILFTVGIIILIASESLFILDERQQAIVLQFGEAQQVIKDAGLHFKLPFIQNVSYYDKRIMSVIADEKEVIAKDQKRLMVSTYAKYKISDPLILYRTMNNIPAAIKRIDTLLDSSMRQALGEVPLAYLLTEERTNIMQRIKHNLALEIKGLGIELIDVRIIRADLPKENSNAIFKRMQTDREREAKLFRAEGEEEATRIRAEAEMERDKIIAKAEEEAQIIKGQADAKVTKIYAEAFDKDKAFFKFNKTMDIYAEALSNKDTTIIMSPDSEILKYLTELNAR